MVYFQLKIYLLFTQKQNNADSFFVSVYFIFLKPFFIILHILKRNIFLYLGYSEAGNFYHLLTSLILNKIKIKESGKPEGPFVPTLINHLSTPVLTINTAEPKFNFPLNRFHYSEESSQSKVFSTSRCYCCPITGACRNSENRVEVKKDECEAGCQLIGQEPSNELFQKQNGAQEDSGIETSDSCDEKKKKTCHRTVKHQHSKLSSTGCSTVKESV